MLAHLPEPAISPTITGVLLQHKFPSSGAMAIAPGMATAFRVVGMSTSTAFAAIVLLLSLNRFAHIYNAKTRLTSAFHLGYGCHGKPPFKGTLYLLLEQMFMLLTLTHECLFIH